jgi:hypothetical protein
MATLAEMIADAIAEHERLWHGPVSAGDIEGDGFTQEEWDRLCKEGKAIDYRQLIQTEITASRMNADNITIGE